MSTCPRCYEDMGCTCKEHDRIEVLQQQLAEAQERIKELEGALESIANSDADDEMDRLHREGTSWERIYEDRAKEALKGAK